MLTFLQNCEISYFLQKEKAYLAVRGWVNVKYNSTEMMVPRWKGGGHSLLQHMFDFGLISLLFLSIYFNKELEVTELFYCA